MPAHDRPRGQRLSAGAVLAPLITLGLLLLFWRLGQKWLAIPVVALALVFFLFMPRLIRSRLARFHKAALLLIASGRADKVPALARRSLLLQLFAPSAPIDAKIGLALAQTGEYARAIPHLDNALPAAAAGERPALRAALVKALFVVGDPARAETEGLGMADSGFCPPEALVATARARLALARIDERTHQLLDEAKRAANNDDIHLMVALTRIEAALATGRKPGEIPEGADSSQRFLRAWIHLVRGQLREHRHDIEGAVESYGKALKEGKEQFCWFANMAHERLEKLVGALGAITSDRSSPESTEMDPSLRRKRKKRR